MSTESVRATSAATIATSYKGIDRDGSLRGWDAPARDVSQMIRSSVDATGWQWLMHQSGLRSVMDAQARDDWDSAVYSGKVPPLTDDNVRATFEQLHASRGDMFDRGVLACFKGLFWDHKTNLPQKFGRRIVLARLRRAADAKPRWGSRRRLGGVNDGASNHLDDLARVFHLLDGKPEPDHRHGWRCRLGLLDDASVPCEDDYMHVKCFLNGSGHVTFKRLDLVDRLNGIIARHYPNALAAPK